MKRLLAILFVLGMGVVAAAWGQEEVGAPPEKIEQVQPAAPSVEEEKAPGEAAALERQAELYESYERLVRVMDIVESRYVRPVESEALFEGAIKGILESLDPYSSYIPPAVYVDFVQETEQHFSGIGVTISVEDDKIRIVSTLEGMPAFEAGVQPGDFIIEIGGEPLREIGGIGDVARKLKGPKDTEVEVTFFREATEKRFTVTLVRADIPIATLRGYRSDPKTGKWDFWLDRKLKVGYIRLTKFAQNTANELDDAYKELSARRLKGLIIDVRWNPGGLLDAAVAIADRFLDEGLIVRTQGRGGIHSQNYATPYDTYDPAVPVVILANEYSASASEVLGGALQDYNRAVLVGKRTFGKGSVQNIMDLDGHGAIRLTVAYYYTPTGRLVHKLPGAKEWGLDPDVAQEMTMEEQIGLREEWGRVSRGMEPASLGEGGGKVLDRQLARAFDILRGGILMQRERIQDEEN